MSAAETVIITDLGTKRQKRPFDPERLQQSVESACLSVGLAAGTAHNFARSTVRSVTKWISTKPEVTSSDLRRMATRYLTIASPEAAYLYKHQHTML